MVLDHRLPPGSWSDVHQSSAATTKTIVCSSCFCRIYLSRKSPSRRTAYSLLSTLVLLASYNQALHTNSTLSRDGLSLYRVDMKPLLGVVLQNANPSVVSHAILHSQTSEKKQPCKEQLRRTSRERIHSIKDQHQRQL